MTASTKIPTLTRLRRFGTTAVLAGTVGIITACAQTAPAPAAGQEPLVISQSTNSALQQYLRHVLPNRGGAFAVSPDGLNSYYVYCPEITCSPNLFGGIAKKQCQSLSGQECMLFYVRNEPRRAYTVATEKTVAGRHGSRRAMPLSEMQFFGR